MSFDTGPKLRDEHRVFQALDDKIIVMHDFVPQQRGLQGIGRGTHAPLDAAYPTMYYEASAKAIEATQP